MLDIIEFSGTHFLAIAEVLGTFAFAVSGAMAAIQKRYDLFGILVLAFATAIGGGTIRDLLVGNFPVSWLTNSLAIWSVFGGVLFTVSLHRHMRKVQRGIFLFDAVGLGLFTVMGVQVGLNAGMGIGISIALGTITGCFGGVVRDILSGVRPLIFRKEIYATASIMGGLIYTGLFTQFGDGMIIQTTAIVCTIGIRFIAYHYRIRLPQFGTTSVQGSDPE
ncbi:trimeric intracellular cation channel family protein [Balneolaceae bacterium ANBcel3]|nr:trimeric intracellular cation channel family protein [Balneolaceae bacterium ANBcel3]